MGPGSVGQPEVQTDKLLLLKIPMGNNILKNQTKPKPTGSTNEKVSKLFRREN